MRVKIHNTLISVRKDHCVIHTGDSKRYPIVGAMHFVWDNVIVSISKRIVTVEPIVVDATYGISLLCTALLSVNFSRIKYAWSLFPVP